MGEITPGGRMNHLMTVRLYCDVSPYSLLCSGGKEGYVRFYDPLLRIVAWFEDLDAGPISGIAFSAAPPSKLAGAELADTINRFIAPDFYVSTTDSKLISVQVSLCSLTLLDVSITRVMVHESSLPIDNLMKASTFSIPSCHADSII